MIVLISQAGVLDGKFQITQGDVCDDNDRPQKEEWQSQLYVPAMKQLVNYLTCKGEQQQKKLISKAPPLWDR